MRTLNELPPEIYEKRLQWRSTLSIKRFSRQVQLLMTFNINSRVTDFVALEFTSVVCFLHSLNTLKIIFIQGLQRNVNTLRSLKAHFL